MLLFTTLFRVKGQDDPKQWFKVICDKTPNGKKGPFLNISSTNLKILGFDFWYGTVTINHPITYFNCRKNHHNGTSLNLTGTRFYYSYYYNKFWSSGCGNLVTIFNKTYNLIDGCLQPSCRINNETSSTDGCLVNIPQGLSSFYVNMSSSDYRRKRSCGFASMISDDYDLRFDISNRAYIPTQLQWGTLIFGECHLNDSSDTYCTSDGTYCWSRLSPKHLCVCYNNDFGYSSSCQGCSTGIGTLFLLLATLSTYKVLKRKQKIMLKQKYFKRNGGLLLQQHLSSNEGQKPISAEQSEPVRSLVSYFLDSMQENSLFNILDTMVVKDGPEQEIIVVALLAKRCLNLSGKKRPTMKQVAMELELIKASGGNVIEDHGDEESEIDDIIHSWETNPSCSLSRTVTTNSVTFPLNSSF
ncbi:hypothetical protein GOBAR_DD34544 [Gossypium barbadense]|nr:hypothetical protein GOBAR_DD34544 [Gossypium barbadense]